MMMMSSRNMMMMMTTIGRGVPPRRPDKKFVKTRDDLLSAFYRVRATSALSVNLSRITWSSGVPARKPELPPLFRPMLQLEWRTTTQPPSAPCLLPKGRSSRRRRRDMSGSPVKRSSILLEITHLRSRSKNRTLLKHRKIRQLFQKLKSRKKYRL